MTREPDVIVGAMVLGGYILFVHLCAIKGLIHYFKGDTL